MGVRGEDSIESLLAVDPFPAQPPRFLRARFERWRFTTRAERAATGAWWHAEPTGPWSPTLRLGEQGELVLAR